jgi:hypothetical protein
MMLIAFPISLTHACLLAFRLHRPRAQEEKLQEVSTVQRQIVDLLLGDHLAYGGRVRVEGHRFRLDLDRLLEPSGLQVQVDPDHLVDAQAYAGPLRGPETLELGGHRVDADGQERNRVVAARVGRGRAGQTREVAVDGDADSGHDRARGVLDRPRDLAGGGLCPQGAGGAEQGEHRSQQSNFPHGELSPQNGILRSGNEGSGRNSHDRD